MTGPPARAVAAPAMREAADVWFDTGRDPVVTWDDAARCFELVDPADSDLRLALLRTERPTTDPERVARVLAEGLAACDFPPTGDGADPSHVASAARCRAGSCRPVSPTLGADR